MLKQIYAAVATLIVENLKTDTSAEALRCSTIRYLENWTLCYLNHIYSRGLDDIGIPAPRIQVRIRNANQPLVQVTNVV